MSIRASVIGVACVAVLPLLGAVAGQSENQWTTEKMVADDRLIIDEINRNSETMTNLEYLSDMIGPRLTGSSQMNQASRWTVEMFRKYGFGDAHLESWMIPRGWQRISAQGRIVRPVEHPLTLAAIGWSPGTGGVIRGSVIYVEADHLETLAKYEGRLKGAIVITTPPASLPAPYEKPLSFVLRPPSPPPPLTGRETTAEAVAKDAGFSRARNDFFKTEGVAAVLRDSGMNHGLLNMAGMGGASYDVGAVPTAFITAEDYGLIWRLLKRGNVEIELDLNNSFSNGPVQASNTVAEIRGTEIPDEIVIIGAHLDSWDLGTGATDNGTGSMAVLEAARALKNLGLKPKRTIRFVLFSGEEQAHTGSHNYVETHRAELAKISGVLVHDTGTGRVLTIGLHGNYQDREVMDRILEPASGLGLLEPSLRIMYGTDHASFDDENIPGFFCIQDPAEYPKTHHSQSDTFDKVSKEGINQGAQVLAVWAYNVAQWPELLPRSSSPKTDASK